MTSIYDAELLLVDDNPDLLRLLCEQLSGAGYHHIRTEMFPVLFPVCERIYSCCPHFRQ